MLPDVGKDEVLRALQQFDLEHRPNKNWQGWESNGNYRYSLQQDGKLYPPKMILSLAAGVPLSSFSGGAHGANKVLENLGFTVVDLREEEMAMTATGQRVWWVNQGKSFKKEKQAGFIWAPKKDKGGAQRSYHHRLKDVSPGDVIVHYSQAKIRALGRVLAVAEETDNPHDDAGDWNKEGWQVAVEYFDLGDRQVDGKDVPELFRGLAIPNGPFQKNRAVKVGYLWCFDAEGLDRLRRRVGEPWPDWADISDTSDMRIELATEFPNLQSAIAARGFVFEPWQIATYISALRTKPFVILAGVSGTGKSKLPVLVATATGGKWELVPVRPDWTDSSDVLGYLDLQSKFRPGPLLEFARRAMDDPSRYYTCVVDEMNLARVEYYFAEVLSRIESRTPAQRGGFASHPLLVEQLGDEQADWCEVHLPPNLALVGTVNMDESTHGFSRKVLDRAFTLELSDVDLGRWGLGGEQVVAATNPWPANTWYPRAIQLDGLDPLEPDQREEIDHVIETLMRANQILAQAQLQVGYRTRDEVALFVLNARELAASFVTSKGESVDPLDLALQMKLLPRIAGGSAPVRQVVLELLGFATTGKDLSAEQDAEAILSDWKGGGRPPAIDGAKFPRTGARLALMWERLLAEGFTSFWL